MVDVYADLLFAVDFCMDYVCLVLTARVLGIRVHNGRLIAASVIGGAYSVASLFIPEGELSLLAAGGSLVLICLVAFYRRHDSFSRQMKLTFVFLGMNALLGGVVSAVFGLLGRLTEVCFPDMEYEKADGIRRMIFLAAALGCLLARLLISKLRTMRLDRVSRVKILAFGREMTLSALCDTGNLLREPMSGKPCTVIGLSDFGELAGAEAAKIFSEGSASEQLSTLEAKIALIPVQTVNSTSMMLGFYPDGAELLDSEGKKLKDIETVVAVSTEQSIEHGCAVLPGCFT